MPLFTWSNEYSVGVKTLDSQHTNIFDMINDLEQAMMKGRGGTVTAPLLRKLLDYTESHFATEEKLMESTRYAGFERHRAQHVALTQKVSEFIARLERGEVAINVDLLFFLCDWLKTHIKQADQEYSPWMKKQGIE